MPEECEGPGGAQQVTEEGVEVRKSEAASLVSEDHIDFVAQDARYRPELKSDSKQGAKESC